MLTVDQYKLHNALTGLEKVADQKSSMPILRMVKLDARFGVLELTTTDLNNFLSYRLPCEGEIEVCLPVKALLNITRPDKDQNNFECKMSTSMDTLKVSIEVDGLTSTVYGQSLDDYPQDPLVKWGYPTIADEKEIRKALDFILPAVYRDEGRPHLNSILFQGSHLVSTDGHRLHRFETSTDFGEPITISYQTSKTLYRLLKKVEFFELATGSANDKEYVLFQMGPWKLASTQVDTKFPPYEKVIPKKYENMATVESRDLYKALAKIVKSKGKSIQVVINGSFELSSQNEDLDIELSTTIDCANTLDEPFTIILDPRYVLDMLDKKSEDKITMGLNGSTDAVGFFQGFRLAVVMPMRG